MNPNSATIWFPKILAAGLPVPHTVFVPYQHHEVIPIFDGEESEEFTRLISEVRLTTEAMGYPVFVRTDLSSAKHDGPSAYKITGVGGNEIGNVLVRTIEDNEIKFWMERHGPTAIMVREFLQLEHTFTAFNGLPINREWRCFANGRECHCSHFYWPPDAFEHFEDRLPPNWRALLDDLSVIPLEIPELHRMAVEAARACDTDGESWSVDFAKDIYGKWHLIDMAVALDSWHWPGCPQAGIP